MRNIKKLIFAAFLSLTCFGVTHFWYTHSQLKSSSGNNANPIAFAVELDNEVLRRPVARTIWQGLNEGEPLYPGEAIRTSAKGEVRIQFLDSKKYIDIEPESLIVISQANNKEISLDLMDGGLFVGSKDGQTTDSDSSSSDFALTLNSGDGKKVDLSKATAQLSKSTGRSLDVQIIDGKAMVSGQDGSSQELTDMGSNDLFSIESPSLDKAVFINPERVEPVQFAWRSKNPTTQVGLLVGKNRKDLKLVATTKNFEKVLNHKMAPGRYFWKLVYLDQNLQPSQQESQVYRLEVNARYAPAIISPEDKQTIEVTTDRKEVVFKWLKPETASSIEINIVSAKNPSEPVIKKSFSSEDSVRLNLDEGSYYWRASAQYNQQSIWTENISFQVSSSAKPPKPKVQITWDSDLVIKQFFIDQPLATLKWASNDPKQVKQWKVLLRPEDSNATEPVTRTLESGQTELKAALTKPGRYIASIEAIDEAGMVLAKAEDKAIELDVLPLLSPAQFLPEKGDLSADNLGNLKLSWKTLEGAKEYEVTLLNAEGKELKKGKFKGPSTSLVNLLPGKYQVKIRAVDIHNRFGEEGPLRSVVVPENSGVLAPKLRKIQVN